MLINRKQKLKKDTIQQAINFNYIEQIVNSILFQEKKINDRFVHSCSLFSLVLFAMVVFHGESFEQNRTEFLLV